MLDLLEHVVKEAGDKLLPYFHNKLEVKEKTNQQNLVSEADEAVQKFICDTLLQGMEQKGFRKEEIGFLGEEDMHSHGTYTFIIDPIDGTTNFLSGINFFAISISLAINGKIQSGVTYNPVDKVLYAAQVGQGAYKISSTGEKRLRLQGIELKNSLFSTYFSAYPEVRSKIFSISQELYPLTRGLRSFGSGTLELGMLADNEIQIILYGRAGIWDIATASVIFAESGGAMVDWNGNPVILDLEEHGKPYEILACHPSLVSPIISVISKAMQN